MALKLETCALQQIKLAVCENTDVAKNSFGLAWYFAKLLYVNNCITTLVAKLLPAKTLVAKNLRHNTHITILVAKHLYEKHL